MSKNNAAKLVEIMEDLAKPRGDALLVDMESSLHEKQVECLQSVFRDEKGLIFVPCGRKFGKTQLAAYALWRNALTNPGSVNYYIAPEGSHGRKIIWDPRRLQKFLEKDSEKYIARIQDRDMKITFKNGSFIQIVGSENWSAANGLTPNFVVYDEFKAFHPQFHIEMDPNRAAKAAPLLIIGTQPKVGDRNKEQYEALLDYAKDHQKTCAVFTYTTFDNPINLIPKIKSSIDQQIAILRSRGDEDVVQREYFSKIVPGGSKAIFPMLRKELTVKPAREIAHILEERKEYLEWQLGADPGTTTCSASLLMAIDSETKKAYIVKEIYEKDQAETSVGKLFPRMLDMAKIACPLKDIHNDIAKVADEAAAWFMREVMDQFGVYFSPTQKHVNKKEAGISLIKDMLIYDLLVISDECPSIYKEMEEYAKDSKGNIPKRNDHAIDVLRYVLDHYNYNVIEARRNILEKNDPVYSGITHEYEEDELFPVNADLDISFFD